MTRLVFVAVTLAMALAAAVRAFVVQGPIVIGPEGETVTIPGTDCTVSVAGWANSAWVDPESPEGTRRPKPGLAKPSQDRIVASDVADIVRWLTQLFEASEDMRNKTKGACEALGVKHMAIRIVRDDPQATSPGAWKIGTNLILLDMGKAETMGKNIEATSEGPQNPSLQENARLKLRSLLGPVLIPHELDHAMRARGSLGRDEMEALAVEDENRVMAELREFLGRDSSFRTYKREGYGEGGYIPITVDNIRLRVNVAKAAGSSAQQGGGDPQFSELDEHDHAAITTTSGGGAYMYASRPWLISTPAQQVPESGRLARIIGNFHARFSNVALLETARADTTRQRMGFSMLDLAASNIVVADARPGVTPAPMDLGLGLGLRAVVRPARANWRASPIGRQIGLAGTGPLRVLFTSLGESSGAAFRATIAGGDATTLLEVAGLVLEPVSGVTAAEADRAIRAMPGPFATATVSAYCLDQSKAVPTRGAVYRLAPLAEQERMSSFGRIMAASARLRAEGRLVPDTDAADYFHSIRQWATWADIQGIRTEAEFVRALVADARKRVSEAGERWTREIEDSVRAVVPNRWQDVSQVLALARR